MRVALFITIALLTGWVTTSSLETMNRLKAIEKKQEAIIAKIEAIGSHQDDLFTKQWGFLDEISLEAQQAKAMAGNNNQKLHDLIKTVGATERMTMDNITTLHEMKKQQANLSSFVELQVIGSRPKETVVAPPVFPKPDFNISDSQAQRMRDRDAADAARALEGIQDELRWQNTKPK